MKNRRNKLIVLLFIVFAIPFLSYAQDSLMHELSYSVDRIQPSNTISKDKLTEAHTLSDLNRFYRASWVREYISVEILTSYKGELKKTFSNSDTLTQVQNDMMNMADFGSDISVKVHYIPENNLKQNDTKDFNFTFTVDPEFEAEYPGGHQQLNKHLKERAIDKIPVSSFKNYDLAAIKFTISEEGEIINVHVFDAAYQAFNNEPILELLLKTVRNMPCWEPAKYSNGDKVKQEFVLTVGNMKNCVINLLGITQD